MKTHFCVFLPAAKFAWVSPQSQHCSAQLPYCTSSVRCTDMETVLFAMILLQTFSFLIIMLACCSGAALFPDGVHSVWLSRAVLLSSHHSHSLFTILSLPSGKGLTFQKLIAVLYSLILFLIWIDWLLPFSCVPSTNSLIEMVPK